MSEDLHAQLQKLTQASLGTEADLSDIHAAIEFHAIWLDWKDPLNPQLEQALRNLAAKSPMARYAANRSTFWGLLNLLEWPELVRLEERLRAKRLAAALERAIGAMSNSSQEAA